MANIVISNGETRIGDIFIASNKVATTSGDVNINIAYIQKKLTGEPFKTTIPSNFDSQASVYKITKTTSNSSDLKVFNSPDANNVIVEITHQLSSGTAYTYDRVYLCSPNNQILFAYDIEGKDVANSSYKIEVDFIIRPYVTVGL